MKPYYTVSDVSHVLRINRRTVYRMIAAGLIKTIRVKHMIRLTPDEFAKLKSDGCNTSLVTGVHNCPNNLQ